jgi:hypothetical protein
MLQHSEYTSLLKGLAETHQATRRTDGGRVFTKLILSADPVAQQVSLSTFYSKLKESFGSRPFVLGISYAAVHQNSGADQFNVIRRVGFLVLAKAVNTDEGRDQVLDTTEAIGYDLMAAIGEQFRGLAGRRQGRMLDYESLAVDSIGPVGDMFCGTRFEFDVTESATQALTYNPAKFQ